VSGFTKATFGEKAQRAVRRAAARRVGVSYFYVQLVNIRDVAGGRVRALARQLAGASAGSVAFDVEYATSPAKAPALKAQLDGMGSDGSAEQAELAAAINTELEAEGMQAQVAVLDMEASAQEDNVAPPEYIDPDSSSGDNTALIGGVVGGACGLVGLAAVVVHMSRKKQAASYGKSDQQQGTTGNVPRTPSDLSTGKEETDGTVKSQTGML
jgi:hypothetical protein